MFLKSAPLSRGKEAGMRSVIRDGKDNSGKKVSCGTYFLKIETKVLGKKTLTFKASAER